MEKRDTWLLRIYDESSPRVHGYGECAPLPGLSVETGEELEGMLRHLQDAVGSFSLSDTDNFSRFLDDLLLEICPSLKFGLETATLDLANGGKRLLYPGVFTEGRLRIPINGLIWMGDEGFMREQIDEKISRFSCIKVKIGSLEFEKECEILGYIRKKSSRIQLRLDANGAFKAEDVEEKLGRLAEYNIHSIEQPIAPGQWKILSELCLKSPVPIALDEELIGFKNYIEKQDLLQQIGPQYIVLKPTLVGGFSECSEWIKLADKFDIDWWITSALESNVGLNAIAQYVAMFKVSLSQGLGTGGLYENNFDSPLKIKQGGMAYQWNHLWDLRALSGLFL